MRISDWSSDVCSSDLFDDEALFEGRAGDHRGKLARAHIDALHNAPALDRHAIGIGRRDRLQPPTEQLRPALHVIGEIVRFPEMPDGGRRGDEDVAVRSEEHTSELQSLMRTSYAVFCLKNKNRRK